MQNTVIATIDLAAIRHNLAAVRRLCPNSRVMAVVKADAYGHGLLHVAKALSDADGLAVARLEEALLLRGSGITQRVLLLATVLDRSELSVCSEQDIDVVAHNEPSVEMIVEQVRVAPLCVWLKVDTGMHRIGLSREAFTRADRLLSGSPGVRELIHMSHFSAACDRTSMERQLAYFTLCHESNAGTKVSLANSGALIHAPQTHYDWVRPGIMLYGDNPMSGSTTVDLRPAMTLRSYVIAVRDIAAGEAVGYGSRWISPRASRIGTIGIGYGDGYPRHARDGTPVLINGIIVPLVGRVSMDSLTVDLTDAGDVAVGDEAVLWGQGLPVASIAAHADTISYELLTRVMPRVTRKYIF